MNTNVLAALNLVEIASTFIVMFAVIDITGAIPLLIDLRARGLRIVAWQATLISFSIMFGFLFVGKQILSLFGVGISSFAIAGAVVLFLLAMEMLLDRELFRTSETSHGATIVPIAFPLIAGAGAITTLLSLRAEYHYLNIMVALLANAAVVYVVLRMTDRVAALLGPTAITLLKKFFGIILLAVAVKLFVSNTGIVLPE